MDASGGNDPHDEHSSGSSGAPGNTNQKKDFLYKDEKYKLPDFKIRMRSHQQAEATSAQPIPDSGSDLPSTGTVPAMVVDDQATEELGNDDDKDNGETQTNHGVANNNSPDHEDSEEGVDGNEDVEESEDDDDNEEGENNATSSSNPITPSKKVDYSKHKPVTPKGTTFRWEDNMQYKAMAKAPFAIGVARPDLLQIVLQSTDGKKHTYSRTGYENPEWNNAAWIKRSNEWIFQIIARVLNRKNPETSTARPAREPWSERECASAKLLIEARRRSTNRENLVPADWEAIAEEHNKKFVGQMLRVGERLVVNKREGHVLKRKAKEFITEDKQITARSAGALKTASKRWEDTANLEQASSEHPDTEMAENEVDQKEPEIDDEPLTEEESRFDDEGDDEEMGGM